MTKELEYLGAVGALNQASLFSSENSTDSGTLSDDDKLMRPDEHFKRLITHKDLLPDRSMAASKSLSALD